MKNLKNFAAIAFCSFISLAAFSIPTKGYSQFNDGTYCSIVATDGVWAFSFADASVNTNCRIAQQAIAYATRAPIVTNRWGYFDERGSNQVTATCFNGSRRYFGFGVEPLQRAYADNASYGRGCVFYVN